MSRTIDEKVVEMRFDNQDFEKNVSQSMSTLDKLKSALNFSGMENAFSGISSAADKVNFGGLSGALDTVSDKFSALEAVAVGALMNIGAQVSDLAIKTAKELTIDQITAGFDKYATKSKAVQTIMNATGLEIGEVSDQLEKLNWYTDETSYDFAEMVTTIGKFTANGVDLETSLKAMEGIANWAGVSGADKNKANMAFYNLAQALSLGFVGQADWRSIMNAGMDTQEFRQMAMAEAIRQGTLAWDEELENYVAINKETQEVIYENEKEGKKLVVTAENFYKTLTKGRWFDTDVLLETLDNYGRFSDKLNELYNEINSQEGFEVLTSELVEYVDAFRDGTIDMQEAMDTTGLSAERLTSYLDVLSSAEYELSEKAYKASYEARTFQDAIDATKDAVSTQWMNTFEYLFGNYEEAVQMWTALSEELWDIFAGPISDFNDVLKEWKDLDIGGREDFIKGIKNIYFAIRSLIDPISEAWDAIFPSMTAERLAEIVTGFEKVTSSLSISEDAALNVTAGFEGIFGVFKLIGDTLNDILLPGFKALVGFNSDMDGGFFDIFGQFGEWLSGITDSIRESEKFIDIMNRVQLAVHILGESIHNLLRPGDFVDIFQKNGGGFGGAVAVFLDMLQDINRAIGAVVYAITGNGEFLSGIDLLNSKLDITSEKVGQVVDTFEKKFGKISDIFKPIVDAVKSVGEDFFAGLVMIFEDLGGAAIGAVDGLNGWLDWVNAMIESSPEFADFVQNLKDAVQEIGNFISHSFSLRDAIQIYRDAGGGLAGFFAVIDERVTYVIESLFDAIQRLTGIDLHYVGDNIILVLHAIADGVLWLADTIATAFGWENNPFGKMLENGAGALEELKEKISGLDGNGFSVKSILDRVSGAFKNLWELLQKAAPGIAGLLGIVGEALKWIFEQLSKLTLDDIIDIAKLGSLLYLVLNLSWVLGGLSEVLEGIALKLKAEAIKSIALAVIMIAGAALMLAAIPEEKMSGVITGLAVAFGGLIATVFASSFAKVDDIFKLPLLIVSIAIAMTALAKAVSIMVGPIEEFGKMDWQVLVQGIIALVAILGTLVGAIALIAKMENNALKAAVSIKTISVALLALWGTVELFRLIDWNVLGSSLLKIAAVLTAIGLITLGGEAISQFISLLGSNSRTFSAAILDISEALILLAGALFLFSKIDNFGESLMKLAASLVVLTAVSSALAVFTPLLNKFSESIEKLGKGLLYITLGTAALGLIATLLGDSADQLVDAGIDFALLVITKITERMSELVPAITGLIVALLTEIGNVMSTIDPEPFLHGAEFIGAFILAIFGIKKMGLKATDFVKMAGVLAGIAVLIVEMGALFYAMGVLAEWTNAAELIAKFGEVAEAITSVFSLKFIALITALVVIMALIDKFELNISGGAFGTIVKIIFEVSAIIEAIAGIFTVFGAINTAIDAGLSWIGNKLGIDLSIVGLIEEFGSVMIAIAEVLGNIIGAFAGGIAGGIAESTLKGVSDGLAYMGTNATPFFDAMAAMPAGALEGAEALGKMILYLTAADLLDGMTAWIKGQTDYQNFADGLSKMGPGVKEFIESVKGVTEEDVATATSAADIVMAIADKVPKTGGLLGWITGDADIGKFSEDLPKLGSGLKGYADNIEGLKTDAIKSTKTAVEIILALADKAPTTTETTWFWGMFTKKDGTLDTFGENLASFGQSFYTYSLWADLIKADSVKNSASALKSIVSVAKTIYSLEMVDSKITLKVNNLKAFGNALKEFGEDYYKYYEQVSKITPETMNSITDTITNAIEAFVGSNDENLISKIDALGHKVLDQIINLFASDSTKERTKAAGDMLIDYISEKFVEESSILKLTNAMSTLITDSFGDKGLTEQNKLAAINLVGEIQNGISEAFEAEDGPKSEFEKFLAAVESMTSSNDRFRIFYENGKKLLNSLGNGLTYKDNVDPVKTAFSNFIEDLASAITGEDMIALFKSSGSTLGGAVVSGMSGQEVVQGAKTASTNIATGMADGLKESKKKVEEAAKDMSDSVLKTVKTTFDINSPSIVMKLLGMFIGEGLANGIWDSIPNVEEKVHELSQSVLNGISVDQLIDQMHKIGLLSSDSLGGGVTDRLKELFKIGESMSDSVADGAISELFTTFMAGGDLTSWFTDGILSEYTQAIDAGGDLTSWFTDGVLSEYAQVTDAADYLAADGLISTLESYADGGENAWYTQDVAYETVKTYSDELASHADMAANAAETLAEAAQKGYLGANWNEFQKKAFEPFAEAYQNMTGEASDPWFVLNDTDRAAYEASLTPVRTSSTYYDADDDFDYRMNTYGAEELWGYILAQENDRLAHENALLTEQVQHEKANSDSVHWRELTDEIHGMREDLSDYNDNMSNLQVVTDTGTLVGELAPKMDKALGSSLTLYKRGV